jgi:hypothetical protein
MREPGWGVGHAGPKLHAKKNPGQAGLGQGRASARRKEKKRKGARPAWRIWPKRV